MNVSNHAKARAMITFSGDVDFVKAKMICRRSYVWSAKQNNLICMTTCQLPFAFDFPAVIAECKSPN